MVNYSAQQLDNTFIALANTSRRDILRYIQTKPGRLVDIADSLRLSLPSLNKHIKILERASLIHKKKIGRERFVSTDLAALQSAEEWIANYTKFWSSQFQSLDSYVGSPENKNG